MQKLNNLIRSAFKAFAEYGLRGNEKPYVIRQYMIINLFMVVVTTMASAMFAINYAEEQFYNSSVIAFMIIIGLILFMVHLGVRKHLFSSITMSLYVLVVSFSILWLNLEGESIYHWLYIMPIILLYIGGGRIGGIATALLFGMISLLVFASYESNHLDYIPKLRFFLSFATISLLAAIAELAREQVEGEWRKVTHRLDEQAHTDTLTGLYNRRDIFKHIKVLMDFSASNKTDLSVIMCDIDHFKVVNDKYGHHAGDTVLVYFSKLLKGMIRGNDVLCRWGGEEFLLILPETPDEAARTLSERLRKKILSHDFVVGNKVHNVTASFGVAAWDYEMDIDTLIQAADKRMYQAKAGGRNQVC